MRKNNLDLNEVLFAIENHLVKKHMYDTRVRNPNEFVVMNSKPKLAIGTNHEKLYIKADAITLYETFLYKEDCVDSIIKWLDIFKSG